MAINRTIKRRILFSVITPFLMILVIVFIINYNMSKAHLIDNFEALQLQDQKHVTDLITELDKSCRMAESFFVPMAKDSFKFFVEEYKKHAGDPMLIDLNAIKDKYGSSMHFYIINRQGFIVNTTYAPYAGTDLKTIPGYSRKLEKARTGNTFVFDRLNYDNIASEMRFEAFIPAPDHEYILALSLAPSTMQAVLNPSYESLIEKNLKKFNPALESVNLFNYAGYSYYNPSSAASEEVVKALKKVKSSKKRELVYKSRNRLVKYLYIDLYDSRSPILTDPSYLVRITYNLAPMNRDLTGLLKYSIVSCLLYLVIGTVIIVIVTGKITKPIVLLYNTVRRFAEMDFSARAPIKSNDEIGRLSGAFNIMASTIEEYSTGLEQKVEERTRELSSTLEQLGETQEQAIQNEKMASLGQLVAGIAHEINTPLASIKSNIGMEKIILEQLNAGDNEDLNELYATLKSTHEINVIALDRIIHIVKNLRNFARLDESDFKEADLHEGIDSTLQLVNYQVRDKVRIIKDYGQLPLIACYPRQLNQVFLNIIVNAIQSMDNTGELTIKTRCEQDRILISFKDNGSGISEENLKKIFNPGFTTKGVGVGTGLGLSISYRIIEKHNGKIHVSSKLGEGTEFVVELPVRQPEKAPAEDR